MVDSTSWYRVNSIPGSRWVPCCQESTMSWRRVRYQVTCGESCTIYFHLLSTPGYSVQRSFLDDLISRKMTFHPRPVEVAAVADPSRSPELLRVSEKTSQSGTSLALSLDKYSYSQTASKLGFPNRPPDLVIQYSNHPFFGVKNLQKHVQRTPTLLSTSPHYPHLCITEMATSNCDFRASTGLQRGRFFSKDLGEANSCLKNKQKNETVEDDFLKKHSQLLRIEIAIQTDDWNTPVFAFLSLPANPILSQAFFPTST